MFIANLDNVHTKREAHSIVRRDPTSPLAPPATVLLNPSFLIGNMSALIRAAHPLAYVSADLLRLPPAECQHPHERVLLFFRSPLSAHDAGDCVCVTGKKQVPHLMGYGCAQQGGHRTAILFGEDADAFGKNISVHWKGTARSGQ